MDHCKLYEEYLAYDLITELSLSVASYYVLLHHVFGSIILIYSIIYTHTVEKLQFLCCWCCGVTARLPWTTLPPRGRERRRRLVSLADGAVMSLPAYDFPRESDLARAVLLLCWPAAAAALSSCQWANGKGQTLKSWLRYQTQRRTWTVRTAVSFSVALLASWL